MYYELAKQLHDAGFPQIVKKGIEVAPTICEKHVVPRDGYCRECGFAYVPTLEELIEACGGRFGKLEQTHKLEWFAISYDGKHIKVGSTPTEAVARLWLALNKN